MNPPNDQNPLRSEYANDPDMSELVTEYVQSMPQRLNSILCAYEQSHREQLIRIVHQLKGSGGGYGFPQLTVAADKLEQRLLNLNDQNISLAGPELNSLIAICNRMAA